MLNVVYKWQERYFASVIMYKQFAINIKCVIIFAISYKCYILIRIHVKC
jgi:hypothetical protein